MFGLLSLWYRFSDKQVQRAQTGIFNALIHKSMSWYDTQSGIMGTLALQNRNVQDLRLGTSASLAFTTESIISIIASLCTSFYFSWSLTLVILATFPIIMLVTGLFAGPINFYILQYKERNRSAAKVVDWCIESISTVKLFNAQSFEVKAFEEIISNSSRSYIRFINLMSMQQGIVQVFIMAMFVQGFWFGSHLVKAGKLSSGDVMSVFWSCMIVSESVNAIIPQMMFLQKALVSVSQICELIEDEHENESETLQLRKLNETVGKKQKSKIHPPECLGNICFNKVSFSYPSRPKSQVLRSLSLNVTPNCLTFIVGQSGSGKSSLCNILSGLYTKYKGEIRIDSYNIKSLSQKWLSENVTIVQQNSVIFDVSISTNIALGKGHENYKFVSKAQIEKACKFAELTATVNQFPLGLETIVSNNILSGGQKQRLAIARAYIRNTPILVLDEAVSALDFHTKKSLLKSIRQWRKNKSTIIITHEMNQIEPNDFVFVMNQGKVIQSGLRCEVENQTNSFFTNALSSPSQIHSGSMLCESEEKAYLTRNYLDNIRYKASSEFYEFSENNNLGRKRAFFKLHRISNVDRERDEEMNTGINQETDDERFASKVKHTNLFPLVWKLSKQIPNKSLFFCGGLAAVANGISAPLFSFTFSKLILGILPIGHGSSVTDVGSHKYLLKWSMIVLALAVIDGITTYAKLFLLETSTEMWIKEVREKCFRKVISRDAEWFSKLEDQRERDRKSRGRGGDMDKSSSTITDVIINETEDMRIIFTRFFSAIINIFALGTMGAIWSLIIGWKLSLVGMTLVPGIVVASKWFISVSEKWETIYQVCVLNMQALNHEVIGSISTIKALSLEAFFLGNYAELMVKANSIAKRKALMTSIGFGVDSIFALALQGLLLYYGLRLAAYGEYSYAQMMQVFSLLIFSLMQASQVLQTIPVMSRGKEAALRIQELLSAYDEGCIGKFSNLDNLYDKGNRFRKVYFRPELHHHKISIQNLSFKYASRPKYKVLNDLSLTINTGECIAITGQSGSGKSTLVSLLTKLYNPNAGDNGKILINDEYNLIEIDPFWYLEHVSLVTQYPVFFRGTIRENILYGYTDSNERAGIDEFIMNELLQGYETLLGDDTGGVGGSQISGGQAQRIAIARVILRQPRILILDECTSALDPGSSLLVQNTVKDIIRAQMSTVIMITHKPEMMRLANRVVVLSGGRIVQDGTYDDLAAKQNGQLYKLINHDS
ncbi:P-loop containing nucleoside triphosphate hydrolase protein [Nadsonia fulvescens var. elongata DSM 6958]|uniref:p-loop containing nucleoside triphosphate hydrolase protein n=1 Tax=Nadsonia fulvescens var. elongata DSM 6958 TaxID=857566 RepID=A0A1E3PGM2_9ASCO|nr:P-loop containing nucleoside triphosphate hydrolase protein [Nadsonia fulvescens var. elongata DSM 6958]